MKKSLPIAALLFFVFIIYFITKPPSILWVDSGTMIAASSSLGIPNPPGFPFYMMASHIFGLIPLGSWLTRLEIFTIIFSLGLLFFVYQIVLMIIKNLAPYSSSEVLQSRTKSRSFQTNSSRQDGYQTVTRQARTIIPALSASFGTVALAFSYQYWSQSQNTEAFIFTYFFVTLFAYLAIKFHIEKPSNRFRLFLLIAFLYGLAIGANPTVLLY